MNRSNPCMSWLQLALIGLLLLPGVVIAKECPDDIKAVTTKDPHVPVTVLSFRVADPAPIVKLHQLADSSVNFICRPWVKPENYWGVYWDITREVKRRFDAEGVSIPFPQRDVHLYQETS